jgi:glycolate oxidase iron-sulfur subunit
MQSDIAEEQGRESIDVMSEPASQPKSIFTPIAGPQFTAPELPTYDALMDCIRCGRCLPACPTYQQTSLETFSPRGRLALMRAVEDGKLDLAEAGLEEHLYHCLDCRSCNTVCPVSIPIGELIVEGRAAVEAKHPRSWIIRLVLQHVLISPSRIQKFTPPVRLAQKLKLDKLAGLLVGWLPPLKDLFQLAPQLPKPLWNDLNKHPAQRAPALRTGRERSRAESKDAVKSSGERSSTSLPSAQNALAGTPYRVGYFLGCVMNVVFADASRATVKLLEHYNCEVVTPNDQMCCGAPQDDQGLKDAMRKMAKKNIAAFERLGDLDVIVADCAACSGFLKEYRHVFHDDPVWAERADRFASKVRDITEWLDQIMPEDLTHPERSGGRASTSLHSAQHAPAVQSKDAMLPKSLTYHEPCHLANVQGVRRQPRALITRLKNKGVDVRELNDPTRCCGSAGIYNLTHPAMSKDLLDRKMDDVAATGAEVVVSANPGCLLQLEWGAKRAKSNVAVKHVTQVLLEAIQERKT